MARRREQLHGARSATRKLPPMLRVMRFLFGPVGALMPGMMGRWAYWLWFRSRRFPESAAGRRAALNAQQEFLRIGPARVCVYSWGEGPAVWFVHGWSGRGSQAAALLEPLLAAGFRVLAVDLPGHGQSSGHSTNVVDCANVLLVMQEHYGRPAAIITHSFGGMVLALALNEGLDTSRAVCFCPPADMQFLVDAFTRTLGMHERVITSLCGRLEQRFDRNFWERISMVCNVRGLDVPALLIHDEDDTSVPWQHSEKIAAAWPGARFMKTSGLGHGRILRDQGAVTAAVEFIRGVEWSL